MKRRQLIPQKPKALPKGSRIALFSTASPGEHSAILAGAAELRRLGFEVLLPPEREPQGYFSASHEVRLQDFCHALHDKSVDGLVATRGGYGSNYLIDENLSTRLKGPKPLIGFSDFTAIQMLMWQVRNWITFYGPMAAAGFNHGAGKPNGYDERSFLLAVSNTKGKWSLNLNAEALVTGEAEGRLVGGCLTLLQTALGTPWQLDARGAILLLEDRGLKPYLLDRALRHLLQAGQFDNVAGFLLGDFPDCDPPIPNSPSARDVCQRILAPLGVPMVYGAPVGHTKRPMLTIPLGLRAQLSATASPTLEFLEPAVTPQ
jgi:muramoyltetrapeptide carboxypeptidase